MEGESKMRSGNDVERFLEEEFKKDETLIKEISQALSVIHHNVEINNAGWVGLVRRILDFFGYGRLRDYLNMRNKRRRYREECEEALKVSADFREGRATSCGYDTLKEHYGCYSMVRFFGAECVIKLHLVYCDGATDTRFIQVKNDLFQKLIFYRGRTIDSIHQEPALLQWEAQEAAEKLAQQTETHPN